MKKAVFLDKDGTLVTDVPYNIDPSLVELVADAGTSLKKLRDMCFELIVISNQSGVARGYFTPAQVEKVFATINEMLRSFQVSISAFFFCPHYVGGSVAQYTVECSCRKPKPGLINKAANTMDIDLSRSWMVGDILDDVEAGNRAGCRTILINNGNETEWVMTEKRIPGFIVSHLAAAADVIVKNSVE